MKVNEVMSKAMDAWRTGDILRASGEPTAFPQGNIYRVFFSIFDSAVYTGGSFYTRNGNLFFSTGGTAVSVGDYAGFRVNINNNGSVELHPVTDADISMSETIG